jgi:type VI secretion system protein ImpH
MAAAHRSGATAVSAGDAPPDGADLPRRKGLNRDPSAFGFFALMRDMERGNPGKPRIGRNATLKDEVVTLGQDPFLSFPDANISHYEEREGLPPRMRSRFLGYFGPQGALPLNTTVEVNQWYARKDDAFVRFADMFTGRFQQLFYRAWADARGITQYDHGEDDRFQVYVGSFAGLGSVALRDRGAVADVARLPVVGLAGSRIKSPVRLRQILEEILKVSVTVQEHVPVWMSFEPGDLTRLGEQGSTLGQDCRMGSRVQSVNEKIRVSIRTESRAEYESFLPGARNFARLTDLLFWYLGVETEVEIAPSLPADQVRGAQLGGQAAAGAGAALGWTAWMSPPPPQEGAYLGSAVFSSTHQPAGKAGNQPKDTQG